MRVIHKLMNLLSLHSNNSNAENKSPQTLVYDTFGVDSHFTSGKEINDYFSDDSIEDEVEDTPREATKVGYLFVRVYRIILYKYLIYSDKLKSS